MEIYTTLFNKYGIFGMGRDWLLFFAHKVKFVARAYEYQAGSDRVCLYADSFLTLTTRGPICHSDLCWPIEKKITI